MMRDKHEFTGDVNIPCEASHRCSAVSCYTHDGQFLRHSITGRQIRNTLQPMAIKERSARQTLNEASQCSTRAGPYGVDLTPYGKQLPDRCDGCEELIHATVHLVIQKLWDAYLDVPSALSTGFDKGFVRTSCSVEVVSRVDGTNSGVEIIGRFIRVCIHAEQFKIYFVAHCMEFYGPRARQSCR
jgi:hypothetical protein